MKGAETITNIDPDDPIFYCKAIESDGPINISSVWIDPDTVRCGPCWVFHKPGECPLVRER